MTDYDEQFPQGFCQVAARCMTEMHPELSYVEGYLVFTSQYGQERRTEHCWNETPDGTVVDSVAWNFEDEQPYRYERDPEAWARLAAVRKAG